MLQRINKFFRSEKGQGIVEYALILAFVAGIAAFALVNSDTGLGATIKGIFTNAQDDINTAAGNE